MKEKVKEDLVAVISHLEIHNIIYTIRGQQVMLDADLAELYGYTVKRFNQQVRRNRERFPKDFMFQLSLEESKSIPRL